MARPGRRSAKADTASDLLDAAAELIAKSGLAEIGLREVAAQAGATPAMVRYHFGDKLGLLTALLDRGFQDLAEALNGAKGFRAITTGLSEHLQKNRWLAILMVREVYVGDALRTHFLAAHADELRSLYVDALEDAQGLRRIPGGLDMPQAMLALVALLVFPVIAAPTIGGDASPLPSADGARLAQALFLGDQT